MGIQRTSVPRFKRTGTPPIVSLTPDDLSILRRIQRHRFLRSADLYRLYPNRSADRLSRRLAALYRAGFLDRPEAQIDQFRGNGSQPLVYGLDGAGLRAIASSDRDIESADDIRARNKRFSRENLDHTLATASFLIDIELACRGHAELTFLADGDISDVRAKGWSVVLPWQGNAATVQITPDGFFGLKRKVSDRELRSFYFLEIDRGTMTIAPSKEARRNQGFLYRSSILRKLFAYTISHSEGIHQRHFGIPSARVLFATTTIKRAEQMRSAAQKLVIGTTNVPGALFLFQDADGSLNPLTSEWMDAAGNQSTLIRPDS